MMQRNVCFWHCDGSMRCQSETVSTLARRCNDISVCVYRTQHAHSTLELKHSPVVDFGSAHQGCSVLLKCNVLDSAQKTNPHIVLLCDITRKCYSGSTHRNHSGDHNKGIACRYVVASNRAQVVRSYTCVTTTQAIFPYLLIPAPLDIIERVSHLSHLHRASVSRYSALTRFSCASRSPPPPCPGFGDCLHCSSSLPSLVLSILSVTICRSLCSI